LTHPDRVYWEDAGITKRMLAEYYTQVWDWMAPHVSGRVVALVRCPDGAAGQCFFQKHASAGIDATHLTSVPDDGDKSIAVDRVEGVVSLAQAGVLEIHVRGSTTKHLEKADRLVFDLDPAPDVEFTEVVDAAKEMKQHLADVGLESFCKTTGGKGLHVVAPILHGAKDKVTWKEAKAFARGICEWMAAEDSERYLLNMSKKLRKGKIFLDYLRNDRMSTAVSVLSPRARAGATVSMPLTWAQVRGGLVPTASTAQPDDPIGPEDAKGVQSLRRHVNAPVPRRRRNEEDVLGRDELRMPVTDPVELLRHRAHFPWAVTD